MQNLMMGVHSSLATLSRASTAPLTEVQSLNHRPLGGNILIVAER